MATYTFDGNKWYWNEQHASTSLSNRLYGAERLGIIAIPEGITCVDEFHRGFQFLEGGLSFHLADGKAGFLYDIHYEVSAFQMQWAFTHANGESFTVYYGLSARNIRAFKSWVDITSDAVSNFARYDQFINTNTLGLSNLPIIKLSSNSLLTVDVKEATGFPKNQVNQDTEKYRINQLLGCPSNICKL